MCEYLLMNLPHRTLAKLETMWVLEYEADYARFIDSEKSARDTLRRAHHSVSKGRTAISSI